MTIREFFVKSVEGEKAAFLRVLDAIAILPREKLDYKPDPKSKTGFELAQLFPREFGMIKKFLDTGVWNMEEETSGKVYNTMSEVRADAETAINAVGAKASSMTEEDWASEGTAWVKMTKGGFAMDLLFDLVHHRGQLSTYIRAMGGKNPSIYGPSADITMEELMKQA